MEMSWAGTGRRWGRRAQKLDRRRCGLKKAKGRHLLSADGSRNNCPFSAGKLPQGIVLG